MKADIQDFLSQGYTPPVGSEYTVFFGKTNSGKSTLINMFLSVPYSYKKKKMVFQYQKLKDDITSPKVGNQTVSCTKNITPYHHDDKIYVDTPGMKTTEGTQEEFFNTILESKLYLQGRKIKFVFVVDINQLLSMKGGGFRESLQIFLKRCDQHQFLQLIPSTILVFTKVNLEQINKEDITQTLIDIASATNITKREEQFLQMMIQMEKVKIMPRFDNKDCFQQQINQISQTLNRMPLFHLFSDLALVPSSEVQNLIRQYIKIFSKKLQKVSQKISSRISKVFSSKNKNIEESRKQLLQAKFILEQRGEELFEDINLQHQLMRIFHSYEQEKEFFSLVQNIAYFGSFLPNFCFDVTLTDNITETVQNQLFQVQKEINKKKTKAEFEAQNRKLENQRRQFQEQYHRQIQAKLKQRDENFSNQMQNLRSILKAESIRFQNNARIRSSQYSNQQLSDSINENSRKKKFYDKNRSWSEWWNEIVLDKPPKRKRKTKIFRGYQTNYQPNIYPNSYQQNIYPNSYQTNIYTNPYSNPPSHQVYFPKTQTQPSLKFEDLGDLQKQTDDPVFLQYQITQLEKVYEKERREIEKRKEEQRRQKFN